MGSDEQNEGENEMMTKIVHVQSVLPYEDALALKKKTGEASIKEAISKAIYHFLKCQDSDREIGHDRSIL